MSVKTKPYRGYDDPLLSAHATSKKAYTDVYSLGCRWREDPNSVGLNEIRE